MPTTVLRSISRMNASPTVDAIQSLAGAQAQTGWQTLVEGHGPDVWRLILSRSRDTNEAEDAYQDFWMALPKSAASFRPSGADPERSARAWLLRVAYTTAIDRVRRRRSATVGANRGVAMAVIDQQTPSRLLVEEAERPGTEDLRDRELLLMRVQDALKDLAENHRRPLLLHVIGGLSYEDLAADLRCTVATARVRVHRALKRLRGVLGGPEERLNERALAGLIVPMLLAVPPAPALATALSSGGAGLTAGGVAGGGTVGSGATAIVPVAVAATGVIAAGIIAVAVLGGSPRPPASVVPSATTSMVRMLDDFERADAAIAGQSYLRIPPEISLAPAPAGGGGGSALRFGWSKEHENWIDCHYRDQERPPLDGVTATAASVASMQVWAPHGTRLRHLAIRFMDVDGEMFEWRHPLPDQGHTGWRTVEFPLDPSAAASWDKRPIANHIVDPPLRLQGYALEIGRDGSKDGVVIIDDVRIRLPKMDIESLRDDK